jgi:quinone-modifying oxidoreductase subunit QmoA
MSKPLLVVGAGVAGVTAALEAAEAGYSVVLCEREAFVGGRVTRMYQYFPKLCPPSCGLELKLRQLEKNPRVRVLVQTVVAAAEPSAAGWQVRLKSAPAYVNARCTACGACSKVCPAQSKDLFNLGLTEAPVIRLSHADAWPRRYTIDRAACPPGCARCVEACEFDAIDLSAAETTESIEISAVVLATGWRPYAANRLPELGAGLPNVVANVQVERMASPTGPTRGQILRPSDGGVPKRVAFVQCAGSRDVKHLPYCSGVCCLAALKQASYVKAQHPQAEVTLYYIDRRAPGRNEELLVRMAATEGVHLVKAKVGAVTATDAAQLALDLEDAQSNQLRRDVADLVVLSTGMVPHLGEDNPFGVACDADGFGQDDSGRGLFVAGVAQRPQDVVASVRAGTAAAAKAIAAARRLGVRPQEA